MRNATRRGAPLTKLLITLLALTPVALGSGSCATNPVTGRSQLALISEQQEIALGRQSHQEILATMGAYDDPDLQAYVERIGQRLAKASERPDLPWTFTVIDDPAVNAFALPGGFIYLTRGILGSMSSEAEMVSVLGHEIGHVTARHAVARLSKAQLANLGLVAGMIVSPELRSYGGLAQTGLGVMFLKFSRDDERQADDLGFRYMNQAGYDPHQMVQMFRILDRVSAAGGAGRLPDWLATHPNPGDRIERIEQDMARTGEPALGAVVDRRPFLQQIDGIVYGQNPREGFFDGTTFYHPELAVQVRFPDGWTTQNRRDVVVAVSPKQDAAVSLTLAKGGSAEDAAREFFTSQSIQTGNAWRSSIDDLPAVSRTFSASRDQAEALHVLAAFVQDGQRVYRLLGFTTEGRFQSYSGTFERSVESFGRLRDRRYLDVEPKRITLVRLPRAMTLRQCTQKYPSTVDLETLGIINGLQPDDTLAAGDLYKRVTGGELP